MTTEEENQLLKTLLIDSYKRLKQVYNGTDCVGYRVADDMEKGLCDIEDSSRD